MAVTYGKEMIAAEVEPWMKERLKAYAVAHSISEAEAIRRALGLIFSFTDNQKEPLGGLQQ